MDNQSNDEIKAVIAKTTGRPCKCMAGGFIVPDGATGYVSAKTMAALYGNQFSAVHFLWEQPDKTRKRCLVDFTYLDISTKDMESVEALHKQIHKDRQKKELEQLKPEPKFKPMSAIANFDKVTGNYIIAAVEKTKDGFNLQVLCTSKGEVSSKPNVGEQPMAFDKQDAAEKAVKDFGLEASKTMNVVVLKIAKVIS